MKRLLLLRHAKSSWDDGSLPDHERPLNNRGKKAAPRMGRFLRDRKLVPDLILSSTAVRARKTAEAVAEAGGYSGETRLVERLYLATPGTLLEVAQTEPPDSVQRLMLVGHNPGMEDLVAILAGRRERFPTAALAVFDFEIDGWRSLELGRPVKLAGLWRPKEIG